MPLLTWALAALAGIWATELVALAVLWALWSHTERNTRQRQPNP